MNKLTQPTPDDHATSPKKSNWLKIPSKPSLLRFGPSIICEIGWWVFALTDPTEHFGRFTKSTPFIGVYWYMSLTMVLGSIVAGLTSEGGGAIAFPVMTLALGVPPPVARDFSFAIQSFGMTCAAITIFGLGVPVDMEALLWGSIGGAVGLAAGLVAVAPHLPPAYAKMLFVSVWASFAVALFRLNQIKDRKVFDCAVDADDAKVMKRNLTTPETTKPSVNFTESNEDTVEDIEARITTEKNVTTQEYSISDKDDLAIRRWRIFVIFCTGFFGGICSSVAGSGLDMASFSILTLYFRVSEKVATPTSVILMAINAILGLLFRLIFGAFGVGGDPIHGAVWEFLAVCVPIVVWGAPLGATIAAHLQRLTISKILYILDTIQFVAALVVIQPWSKPFPNNVGLCVSSSATLIFGSLFFHFVARLGDARINCAGTSMVVAGKQQAVVQS